MENWAWFDRLLQGKALLLWSGAEPLVPNQKSTCIHRACPCQCGRAVALLLRRAVARAGWRRSDLLPLAAGQPGKKTSVDVQEGRAVSKVTPPAPPHPEIDEKAPGLRQAVMYLTPLQPSEAAH